ncbi:MAG: hypothetical protein IT281_01860 [Ignavibacteria bacterium]|nr:hypothetical protein [Ignavibacteria bacterium]MCC7158264.1 hypothetical protein [Ignavibacteria bacterium]
MDEKELKNSVKTGKNTGQNGKVLRCINIDCVFNSSNEHGAIRNTCNHPNVVVESRFADITIAICSEFRSKKDYTFEKPDTLIDLKSREKTLVVGKPEVGDQTSTIEKITTKDLEKGAGVSNPVDAVDESSIVNQSAENKEAPGQLKPVILEAEHTPAEELTVDQIYNLSTKQGTDFLILKKIYQPNIRIGLILSVISHFFMLFIMYQFLVPKEETPGEEHNQRIVVVEDLEMPKFDPPDIDKMKEEEDKLKEESEIENNTKEVRPKINKKTVTPKINRPKDNDTPPDSNSSLNDDSNKVKIDSSLVKNTRDTSRIQVPDSMKSTYDQNDVGLKLWYPVGWKLIDSRQINLTQKEFNGVILNPDSLSTDPGAVNMFILIDDPQHSAYNKATYKNAFQMDDSLTVGYVTDPIKSSGKKLSAKYFLFTDPTGMKNIQVNVDFVSQEMLDKYQKLIDAIVRSIKIVKTPEKPGP